nr:MAG TPA: hypothetical protein [Caudoviricetes sp.]
MYGLVHGFINQFHHLLSIQSPPFLVVVLRCL